MSSLTVFKYPIPLTDSPGKAIPIKLPAHSKIMKVGVQNDGPLGYPKYFMWALVDPDETLSEIRYVVTAGTGHRIPRETLAGRQWDHVDSLLSHGGALVIHVWISVAEGKGTTQVNVEG